MTTPARVIVGASLALLAALAVAADSANPQAVVRAVNSATSEMVTCAGYFEFVANAARDTRGSMARRAAALATRQALDASNYAMDMGEPVGQSPQTIRGRIKLALADIVQEAQNASFADLIDKYGYGCVRAIEAPKGRVEYWLANPS